MNKTRPPWYRRKFSESLYAPWKEEIRKMVELDQGESFLVEVEDDRPGKITRRMRELLYFLDEQGTHVNVNDWFVSPVDIGGRTFVRVRRRKVADNPKG